MSVVHGYSAYSNGKCRCLVCTEANRVYNAELRARRAAKGLAADDPRHGTTSTYVNYGCRCDDCRAATSEYEAMRQRRKAASR